MQYDDLFEYTGHMGRYQWTVFAVIFGLNIFSIEVINMIFVGGEMDHWCSVDELSGLTPEKQRYVAIPMTSSPSDDVIVYSSCEMFDVNWTTFSVDELMNWNRTEWLKEVDTNNSTLSTRKCSKWNYDQSMFTSTIVSRFDLVCGREFLVELTTTLMLVGALVGSLSSGPVSDRFGRKWPLVLYLFIKVIGSAIAIFARNYVTFVIGRFVNYTGTCAACMNTYVLLMELVGPKYQTVVGVLSQASLSIGFLLTPVVAYFIRDDFYLQIAMMGPAIVFIPCAFFMPESPRWLIVKKRYDEALKIIQKICKVNNAKLPEDLDLSTLEEESEVQDKGCSAIILSPSMRLRTLLVNACWFTTAMVYFAFSVYSNYDSGNLYLTTFISGTIEIPIAIFAIFIVDLKWFGRSGTISYTLIGAGLACFVCAIMVTCVFTLIGKSFITLTYTVVYLYGSEVFPTEVRTTGLAIASTCEGVGGMLAPVISGPLKRLWLPLPLIIYGVLSTLSGFSHFYLPETRDMPLMNTVEQADKMAAAQRNEKKRFLCTRDG